MRENRKEIKKTKKAAIILTVILALAVFVGCGTTNTELMQNGNPAAKDPATNATGENAQTGEGEEIPVTIESEMSAETQTEIKKITDAFVKGLDDKNAAEIMGYLDAEMSITQGEMNGFFRSATANGKAPYVLYNTYYVNGIENPEEGMRVKKAENDTEFVLFTPGSKEACVALFSSENDKVSQMITAVIARKDSAMKIVYIDTSDSGYYGKNATEYLKMAKEAKESGKDALSYVYANMMMNICQPGNALWYDETEGMVNYYGELSNWHSENYPKTVIDDKHDLQLIGLSLEEEGIVPMIFYKTELDINGAEIDADAEKVKDAFLKDNPDMAEGFSKIVVHASNINASEVSGASDYKKIVFDMK